MRVAIVAMGLFASTATAVTAEIVSHRSVGELAAAADAIVVGGPVSPPGADDAGTSLAVVRVLKGTVPSIVNVSWTPGRQHGERAFPYGIWFLQESSPDWTLLPITWVSWELTIGAIPLPSGDIDATFAYAPADPVIDKLIAELRSGVRHSAGTDLSAVAGVLATLKNARSPEIQGKRLIEEHFESVGGAHANTCEALRLIREWDTEVVALARQLLQQAGGDGSSVLEGVVSGVCHIRDPRAVVDLGALGTGVDGLRDCAAEALRNIHNVAAVPYLAAFLSSASVEQQFAAVSGLAAFANNDVPFNGSVAARVDGPLTTAATRSHEPSPSEFVADRAKYVSFWAAWANCSECRLDQTPPSVSVLVPTEESTLAGVVTLIASATDASGVANVQFYIDGVAVGEPATGEPYQASLDTRNVPDGAHEVAAEARDRMDNAAGSAAVSVMISNPILTVAMAGTGTGLVTSSDFIINCGTACDGRFAAQATVTLTATPGEHSKFAGWRGACSGTASTCTVVVTGSQLVTAVFQ